MQIEAVKGMMGGMIDRRIAFTERAIAAIVSADKRTVYYDTKVRGLALFVTHRAKVWYYYAKVKGRPVQIKIGVYPDTKIPAARERASSYNAARDNLQDVRKVAREADGEMTVGELMAWYVDVCSRPHKKTWKRDEDNIRRHLASVDGWPISRLTRQEVRTLHTRIGEASGHSSANHVLALVRTVFNRAVEHEKWDGANPAVGVKPFREKSRDRRLMPGEIPAFFEAVMRQPNAEFRDFILLALFTGARKANVLAMRWDQIDLVGRTWRIPETKNGTPQTIPLGDPEIEILTTRKKGATSPWVLPSETSASGHLPCGWRRWKNLIADAGLPPCSLRIHDLRRTLGSWMVDTGATLAVIGQTLHHKSPSATAIYARLSLDPVREAKGRAIDALLKARSNDVAP